jgi:hypothetical protein
MPSGRILGRRGDRSGSADGRIVPAATEAMIVAMEMVLALHRPTASVALDGLRAGRE